MERSTKALLNVYGTEAELGFDELGFVADILNDSFKNMAIFKAMAKSEVVSVKVSIASKRTINRDIFDLLVNDPNIEVLRALVSNRYVDQYFEKVTLKRILGTEDCEIFTCIAGKLELFTHIVEIDWLCETLIQGDPSVRYELAKNDNTPIFYLTELSSDRDIKVAEMAEETLHLLMES